MNHRPGGRSTIEVFVRMTVIATLVVLPACGSDDSDVGAVAATTGSRPAAKSTEVLTASASTTTATAEPVVVPTAEPVTLPASGPGVASDPAVAPEMEQYCAVVAEVDASEPTVELVRRYVEVAPDEISGPAAAVLAAFEKYDGDMGAVFGDPEAAAAIGELSSFEGETCGSAYDGDPSATEIDPDAQRIDVTATDYHFDLEYPTSEGRYSFVMDNEGDNAHLMVLVRLDEETDIDEFLASEDGRGVLEDFHSDVAAPGARSILTADLASGRWVLLCPIPAETGTSHAQLGMVHEFDVG